MDVRPEARHCLCQSRLRMLVWHDEFMIVRKRPAVIIGPFWNELFFDSPYMIAFIGHGDG
jgi:hypothetical protein